MARSRRIEYPGAVYHVTNRGNARRSVFLDNKARLKYLAQLYQEASNENSRYGDLRCTLVDNFRTSEWPKPDMLEALYTL